jgi:hypothetical protein
MLHLLAARARRDGDLAVPRDVPVLLDALVLARVLGVRQLQALDGLALAVWLAFEVVVAKKPSDTRFKVV